MIPSSDFLEQHYERQEVLALEALRKALDGTPDHVQGQIGRAACRRMWPDELTHISKTHFIRMKDVGRIGLLNPNYAQRRFHKDVITACRDEGMPIRGVIL